tara:strand:- start:347 stop:451 length:105 start_codon:yes stop_codon:yes gene_type:complete
MKKDKLNLGEIFFWIIIILLLGLSIYSLFRGTIW